jgi:hypothetical protein
MLIKKLFCVTSAVLLWMCAATLGHAQTLRADSSNATIPAAATVVPIEDGALLTAQINPTASGLWANPFDRVSAVARDSSVQIPAILGMSTLVPAAPAPLPGGSPNSAKTGPSSHAKKTHFEIQGMAQWNKLTSNGNLSYNTTVAGGQNGTVGFSDALGIANFQAGPLLRAIWIPDKKILGAENKFWVEYGQVDRSRVKTITTQFVFLGDIYLVNSTLKSDLNSKEFKFGYAPRWGNDKFKIGPAIVIGYLDVNVALAATNITGGGSTVSYSINVPNPLLTLGADFDYTPNSKFAMYGKAGAVPCCGGGWHVFESEWGAKYFFSHGFGLIGGIKYDHKTRDFSVPARVVGEQTVGPFSGALKFPNWGPFIGVTWKF